MRVKLKHKNEVHELKIEQARFFENLKEDEVEVEFFEDVFLDLNLGMCLELLEKYDLKYLTQGLLYFGFENMLEKISDFLQTKEIEDFFEKHIEKVNWTCLSGNPSLSETFFEKHIKDVNWESLSGNPSLSEAFFEKHIKDVNWLALSKNPSLSEAFFEKYIDKVNWPGLSRNPSLSEVFFEKYLDTSGEAGQKCKVNWSCLSENLSMSEDFFERHIEDVNWVSLSRVPLSVVFFERHVENVYWWVLSSNCFSRVPWRKFLKIEFSDFSTIVIHRASSELNEKSVDFSATSLPPLYYPKT